VNRELQNSIEDAKRWISEADAILITAGAGMGVDSGLPDFRGDRGFWRAYPAIKDLGISFQQMANPKWFETNPKLAWAFYGHRLNLYRETTPHKGFEILLKLVKEKSNNYFIFTSNVDGQFQKAGFDEDRVVEIHGTIHYFQCIRNCTQEIWSADEGVIPIDMKKFEALKLPKCKYCNSIARPNILMFGDWSWNPNRTREQEERYQNWIDSVYQSGGRLAIIEIGAGTAIPTVREEGEYISQMSDNFKLIRINPRDYQVRLSKNISIPLGGLEGIREIVNI